MRSISATLYGSVAALAVGALTLSACGADGADRSSAPTTDRPTVTEQPSTSVASGAGDGSTTTVAGSRGWISGEPDWYGSAAAEAASDLGADSADDGSAPLSAEAGTASRSETVDDAIEPVSAPSDQPLRAGSVDDNVDHDDFLAYAQRVRELGIQGRPFDPDGRTLIRVVDGEGAPVAGATVDVAVPGTEQSSPAITLRTTADGTARFFPGLYGIDPATVIDVSVPGGTTVSAVPGSDVTVTSPTSTTVPVPVPLDVLFLLDATGSMGDEIGRLTQTIGEIAAQVDGLEPRPDVRFGMTLYRDEGDAFLTSTFDLTGDVGAFGSALADVVAAGGGDYPEALDEGLAEALAAPSWRNPAEAVQLVFVVADAPPQVTRTVDTPYTMSIAAAVARGIKIFPVASSESDDVAELVFRQMAVATGAPFVFLSYGAGGAATGPSTDITTTDYEELALDQLVVRLIAEELADLTAGGEIVIPTSVPPSTTIPDRQQQPTTTATAPTTTTTTSTTVTTSP